MQPFVIAPSRFRFGLDLLAELCFVAAGVLLVSEGEGGLGWMTVVFFGGARWCSAAR